MIVNVYAIYDDEVAAYMRPFFAQTDTQALRIIFESSKDTRSGFYAFPSHYHLFFLSTYDDATGVFSNVNDSTSHRCLGTVLEIVSSLSKETSLEDFHNSSPVPPPPPAAVSSLEKIREQILNVPPSSSKPKKKKKVNNKKGPVII